MRSNVTTSACSTGIPYPAQSEFPPAVASASPSPSRHPPLASVTFMAAAASLLPLRLQITPSLPNSAALRFRSSLTNPNPLFPSRSPPVRASPSSSPSSSSGPSAEWQREEARWLREEQRWLREEQRWLREESRWNSEREALLRELATLKLRIEALERGTPPVVPPAAAAGLEVLLRALKDRVAGAESGPRSPPALAEEADVKEMVLEEIRVSEVAVQKKKPESRKPLRKGAEGEEVRAMQGALQRLGFYSGEEDMEFAVFSSGTERAVKTWQASSDAIEDGVMTSELLEKLFLELEVGKTVNKSGNQREDFISMTEKEGANGTAVTSVMGFTELQQTVIKDDGVAGVEVSEHKVFLLGENRWEEPSRLAGRGNLIGNKALPTTKCLSCRGEGRLMCTECDGTGEPNVEPQFLEWVDEGAKCPYCEGLGYTICDVCEGKTSG